MSTTKMDSVELKNICLAKIAEVEERREDEKNRLIAKHLRWRNKVRRAIYLRELTAEDAILSLSNGSSLSDWNTVNWLHWETMDTAKRLLKLAEYSADGYVVVSDEDLDYLT
jgi:hypothetical protein